MNRAGAIWILALVTTLAGCASAPPTTREATAPPTIRYALRPLPSGGGWAVQARLPAEAVGHGFCVPSIGTRAGESLAWQSARDGAGEPLEGEWSRDGCLLLSERVGAVDVRYEVAVTPAARPAWRAISLSPYADADDIIFPGESLFLELPEDSPGRGLETLVSIEGVDEAVASTLSWDGEVYRASDNHALLRSMLWLGDVELASTQSAAGRWWLARDARLSGAVPQSMALETACIAQQLARWAPEKAPAQGTAMVLLAAWDRGAYGGFARQGGVVVQVGAAFAEQSARVRALLAHELFHQINGESLRFRDDAFESTTWFREGATSYVSLVALVHAGLLSRERFVEMLAEHASNYLTNPVHYRHDATELDWRRLPYDRGVLLSFALDLFLRDVSAGRRSLLGFWQHYARRAEWAQPQDNQSLLVALNAYSGTDLSPFFERYVVSGAPIPVRALLANAGLRVVPAQREVPVLDMHVSYDTDRTELVVDMVVGGGVADRAGVRVGDLLRPLPTTRFDTTDAALEFEVVRGGERIFVRLQPSLQVVPAVGLADDEAGPDLLAAILGEDAPAPSCVGVPPGSKPREASRGRLP